jgi:LmbE family N-acetylglucosaminyl deacetylase
MQTIDLQIHKVLVISAHPDDETLGCGGTILKHKEAGDKVYWMVATGASEKNPFNFPVDLINERNETINQVAEHYGYDKVIDLNLPVQLLDTIPMHELVKTINTVITELEPDTIYLPNGRDIHSDHRVLFEAVFACTKSFRKPFIRKVVVYETLSETEFAPALINNAFIPNLFVDITKYIDSKLEIMGLFGTELMDDPFPRSIHAIKGLAAFRGSRIGVMFAEAFQVLIDIRK